MTATDGTGPQPADGPAALDWLLDDLVARTGDVRQAVLLSSDGLATAASQGLGEKDIEHLAAVCSGFHSLAKGIGRHFSVGGVRQTMVMLDEAYLFVTPAGDGSCLAVLSDAGTDVGQLAYEMALLVKRAGRHLGTPSRSA
ncbi:roadblock/LC7 domain-containing protein [Streptomyces sp. RB6PN25]|uniref:Roadblock/LC7 domain-containing protein n=1 Tax=Streptomyces humicola TaxID=2953240 RepID=A0ABT1PP49_9ACTN|nr:roadblock/LC7 domain-containing protein [Streptomyces humicola]MCQ4079449.1 roadblock/LC7 domain-containing protein [Streptomyces humicola]